MFHRSRAAAVTALTAVVLCASLTACGGGGSWSETSSAQALIRQDMPAYVGPVTVLPQDVTRLYEASGDPAAPNAVLYLQGGPVDLLVPEAGLNDLGLPFSRQTLVRVHQASTFNPAIVADPTLSYGRASRENEVSVEILDRVVRHFAAQGKHVYVVGHSFGAFLIYRAIAERPGMAALVDRFLVMNGRLDIPDVVWRGMRDGQQWGFPGGGDPAPTAIQPTRESRTGDEDRGPGEPPLTNTFTFSQLKLQADMGRPRMTQVLAGQSLDRLIVVQARDDEAVGRMSSQELDFLRSAGASLYCIKDGGHDIAFEMPYAAELANLLFGRTTTATRRCD